MFDVKGKVAIVTGGASGIGFSCSKELLRNGLRAVTIADVDVEQARVAVEEIEKEFGPERVQFVKTDVADKVQFEEAFKSTLKAFGNIDIVINNAAVFDEIRWEREVLVNVNGTINGTLLAFEHYLPKHRSGSEAVVLNIASTAAVDQFGSVPIYTTTKYAVVGLSRALGVEAHYNRTKVKVLAVCPGFTTTPLTTERDRCKHMALEYYNLSLQEFSTLSPQSSEFLAKSVIQIIQEGATGSVWVVEGGQPAYELDMQKRKLHAKAESIN